MDWLIRDIIGIIIHKYNSMEGIQKDVENLGVWREKKDKAPEEAQNLIDQIVGYENMTNVEKIAALHALLHELAEDNRNRFVAEVVSSELSRLEEESRHEERMSYLKQAA